MERPTAGDADAAQRPTSAPSALSFDSTTLFGGFGGPSDFFTPMYVPPHSPKVAVCRHSAHTLVHRKYDEDEPAEDSTPTSDNNEVLPPHSLSPTNQSEAHEISSSVSTVATIPVTVASTPALPMLPGPSRRRKNSLDLFLSQSPSQALGGDFLKLSLDDRNPPTGRDAKPMYPPGQFRLDESPKKFGRLGHYRGGQSHAPPPLAISRSSTVPGTSSAGAGAYGAPYPPLSPHMSEDSWSGSQDGTESNNASFYPDHEYYAPAPSARDPSYRREYGRGRHEAAMYRSPPPPSGYASYNNQRGAQWVQPGLHGGYDYMNAGQPSPMGYAPLGMRAGGGGGGSGRATPRHLYARMTPPLPESSPPHSPRKGGNGLGMKQCKFFLQGHCRMGAKCKFAHGPGGEFTPQGQPQQLHRQQMYGGNGGRVMLSPPQMGGHHHAHHDEIGGHSFGRSGGTSRLGNYRSNSANELADAAAGLSAALSVEDIRGRVFAMSKDQNGCRLLQEQLDYADRSDLCDVIYREALDHLAEMMVDPFGNYLFQKLLERVGGPQRLAIIRRVSSNLVAAALNLHGTRSVQKVVEVCATSPEVVEPVGHREDDDESDHELDKSGEERGEERVVNLPDIIVEALKDDAVRLCIDSNGNHVIQRALQFMQPEYNQFVFDAVCKECTTVGTHRHGCCVLQRCLDAANGTQKREVIAQVERQAMKLMQDPYGNYVVQYVLDSCTAEEAYGVIVKPLGHIFELSVQKFSSNVIEKCLEKAPERVRQSYLKEITSCPKLAKMLQDQFANYVVQRALCVCSEEQCLQLVKAIRPHLAQMKNTSGGRRITARILKRFPTMDISDGEPLVMDPAVNGMPMLGGGGGGGYGHHTVHRMYASRPSGAQMAFGGNGAVYNGVSGPYASGGLVAMPDAVGGSGMGMNAASRA